MNNVMIDGLLSFGGVEPLHALILLKDMVTSNLYPRVVHSSPIHSQIVLFTIIYPLFLMHKEANKKSPNKPPSSSCMHEHVDAFEKNVSILRIP